MTQHKVCPLAHRETVPRAFVGRRTDTRRARGYRGGMLYKFLTAHRTGLIERCRAKVARRPSPKATPAELEHGIPMFLDQLIKALLAEPQEARANLRLAATATALSTNAADINATATRHGMELMKQGFTIEQVVHDYGDLCQAITELASQTGAPITVDEFRTLNRCLDDAIASAVAEFSVRHDSAIASSTLKLTDERVRALLHEMRTNVHTAELAIVAIKAGNVGLKGATGALLDLSLVAMRNLIARSLPEATTHLGILARH